MLRNRSNNQAHLGFTLVEVLVAFAIAALTLIVGFQAISAAIGGTNRAQRITYALLAAESKLAEVGVTERLRPGRVNGELPGGYLWQTKVQSYKGVPTRNKENFPIRAYEVSISVSWGESPGQAVTLHTLKLVTESVDGPSP